MKALFLRMLKGNAKAILAVIQHYNHDKYWRRRAIVTTPSNKTPLLVKLYYLYYIKKTDAYHNCSFGTDGPNGIIVGHDVFVGMECTIYQQVTIMHGGG